MSLTRRAALCRLQGTVGLSGSPHKTLIFTLFLCNNYGTGLQHSGGAFVREKGTLFMAGTVDYEIEELRGKVAALEEENRDLTGLVMNSHDGLTILDGEGRFLFLNPAIGRITGREITSVLGRKMSELSSPGLDPSASTRVLQTHKPETVIVNTDSGRQMLTTAVPGMDKDGNIVRIYCNLRDITELNVLKEECERSQMLITKYLVQLEEAKRGSKIMPIRRAQQPDEADRGDCPQDCTGGCYGSYSRRVGRR